MENTALPDCSDPSKNLDVILPSTSLKVLSGPNLIVGWGDRSLSSSRVRSAMRAQRKEE